MTRSLKELTPTERGAYVVWNQKLADLTLSKEEHERAKHELDKILRRGPFGELETLKDELKTMRQRLTALEEYVLTQSPTASVPEYKVSKLDPETREMVPAEGLKQTVTFDVTNSECCDGAEPCVHQPNKGNPPTERQGGKAKDKEENRGRPKLRFHPEKDANKRWMILDREADQYTDHGPYKTRREAKEMVDTLNNMPTPPPVPDTPTDGGEVPEIDPLADFGL